MKVVLYMAATVNGMIAKENDETPWSSEAWQGYQDMVKATGNIIVGARTYKIMKEAGDEFENIGNPFTVVVSDNPEDKKNEESSNHVFVTSPAEALRILRNKGVKTALVGGGATLNTSFIREGLVNEMIIDVEPIVFGVGIPFLTPEEISVELDLLEVKKVGESSTIRIHYKVKQA